MSDATQKTTAEPDIIIDIRGDVSGQVAVGENIYQHQTNVSDGGLAYVLQDGVVPFTKVQGPVRLLSRADPPLLDREEEMAEALGAVRPGGTVQVTGGPGSGKSLFLTHLAHEMAGTVEHGVVHLRARGEPLGDLGFKLFYAFHDSLLPTPYIPPPPQIQRELAGTSAAILIDDVDGLGTDIDGLLDMAIESEFVLSSRAEVVDGGPDVTLGGLPTPQAVDLFTRTLPGPLPDGPGVAELCTVLGGHPQCVVFAARLVAAQGLDPGALAAELSGPDPCHEMAKRLLAALPESEARVAAFLAALEGAPVPIAQAAAATQVPGTGEVLGELAAAGIAPSNSPRHAFNPLLQDAAEELWDLDDLRVTAVDHLTDWLGRRDPDDSAVVETAPMVLGLMGWAAGTGRHEETVALGEGIDGALALSGKWGSWERLHEIVLGSASEAGDAAARGWALHQMGTKALCWGDRSTAESLLREALDIRMQVGVQSAIDTTQHNLDVLFPPSGGGSGEEETPPPPTDPMWPAAFVIGAMLAIILVALPVWPWTKTLVFEPSTLSFRDVPVGGEDALTTTLWNRSDKTISKIGLTIEESEQFAFADVSPVGDSLGVAILAAGPGDFAGFAQPSAGATTCEADGSRFLATIAPGEGCRITVVLMRTSPEAPAATLVARKGENAWSAELEVGPVSDGTATTNDTTTTTNETTATSNGPTTTNGTTTPTNGETKGRIIVEKQTEPDNSAATFEFSGDVAATLGDDGTATVDVDAGQYRSTESVPPDWKLSEIMCDDTNSSGALSSATATFNVEAGETVTCTFTNTLIEVQPSSADLVVTYRVSRDKVAPGEILTYVITVHNHGPARAGNVRAFAALPGEAKLVRVESSPGGCLALPCNLDTVNAGSKATVSLVAQISGGATEGTVLTSTASVVSGTFDPNEANNTASARTRVQGPIDGLIDIEPETIEFGDAPGTEQLRLTNVGGIDVTIRGHSVADPFTAEGCVDTTLTPFESCVISVVFPASGGAFSAVLEVSHTGKGDRRALIKGGG